jgi:hypothetical protein
MNDNNLDISGREFEDCTEYKGSDTARIIDGNFDQHLKVWNDHSRIQFFEAESRWKVGEEQEDGKPVNF